MVVFSHRNYALVDGDRIVRKAEAKGYREEVSNIKTIYKISPFLMAL